MSRPLYERPRILDRIPRDRHAVIEASAGTGKTYTIEHLFTELLLNRDCEIDAVLLLTYTERAAGELRSRIRAMIERLLSDDPQPVPPESSFWQIDETARIKLKRSLFSFDKAPIYTIHGFFQRVLIENAFSSCRLFEQTLVDSRTAFSEAFTGSLRSDLACDPGFVPYLSCWLGHRGGSVDDLEDFLYSCHSRRREIRPVFDQAEVRRILESLSQIFRDGHLDDRIRQACDANRPKKIHGGVTRAIVSRCAHLAGLMRAYDEDKNVAKLLCASSSDSLTYILDNLGRLSTPTDEIRRLQTALSQFIESSLSFDAAVAQLFLPQVRARLESEKRRRGLYDYDDMIGYLIEGLDGPQGSSLLKTLRRRYRYALIDESQDTDDRQWKVFRKVFYESGGANIIYLIGDPKQAIYGFRGADVYTYLAARDVICGSGKPVFLNENYRSTGTLISAYNEMFRQDTGNPFFKGGITYGCPVACGRKDLRAVGPDGREITPVVLLEVGPGGATLNSDEYTRILAAGVAREVKRLLSPGEAVIRFGAGDDLKPLKPRDIFILTRKEQEGRDLSEFLRDEGIPFAFYKQEGLFQTREAEHIRDLLLAVEAPLDNSRRFKAWLTPFFSVPIERLLLCRDLPETEPLVRKLILWHDMARRRDFEGLFSDILSGSGLICRELFLRDTEREITNYTHIFEILLEEATASGCELPEINRALQGFIGGTGRPLRDDADIQRLETEKEAVQIMTMHKSKGLEAAVVFIFGGYTRGRRERFALYHDNGTGVLHVSPGDRETGLAAREALEEDQRLLYVAVTRAKARLYLPFVRIEHLTPQALQGSYAQLNARLADMISEPDSFAMKQLFSLRTLGPSMLPTEGDDGRAAEIVSSWQPEAIHPEDREDRRRFQDLRQSHRGFEVTSYTRIKHRQGGQATRTETEDPEDDEILSAMTGRPEEEIPGGPEYGIALHRILEEVPFESLRGVSGIEEWQQSEEISELVTRSLFDQGLDTRHADYSRRLVYNALTANVILGEGIVLQGFKSLGSCRREASFLYPYPEEAHRRLDEFPLGHFHIDRGYVKGSIDFLFTHGDRTYLVDWKTDILPDYGMTSLTQHVETAYGLQMKLYAIALVKMLKAHQAEAYNRSVGGLLFCFLRAVESPGDGRRGFVLSRPTWREMLRLERELLQSTEYAGAPR